MGLKQDLIDAKIKAAEDAGMDLERIDSSPGSYIERDAHYTAQAIITLLTKSDFTITNLKAPVVVEDIKTPDQAVNILTKTLLGDKAPILSSLKQIGNIIPGGGAVVGGVVDQLEGAIEKAVTPLVKGGAKLPGLDLSKEDGGLESTGYVFIGEDPDTKTAFDVDDESGQIQFTRVKLLRENNEDLF